MPPSPVGYFRLGQAYPRRKLREGYPRPRPRWARYPTTISLTVTAATSTKVYDGGTTSTATPTITSGALASGDSASFTETFDTRNVGSGKMLTPAGSVNNSGSGSTYTITWTGVTTGVITAEAITVSAATNSKPYDGGTSASGVPTVTGGSLFGIDSLTCTESYDTKNVGTGKTLTPAGSVNDGNSGENYSITFANNTTGTITALAITVTAATKTKTYDGGLTASAATPTVTGGALASGDSAAFTETFTNKNVGSGKTLTPTGTASDGNSGNNYSYTWANNTTGSITVYAITVAATANSKVYDSTTSASATPTASLLGSDVNAFTESYASPNVGTTISLIPTGTANDGNGGNNYSYTFSPAISGTITTRAITVTAATGTKTYDSGTTSTATPTVTGGALQGGDTPAFSEHFSTAHAGSNKTLTPTGTASDGNSGANYSYTWANSTTGSITAYAITVTAATSTKAYSATTSSTAVPTITGGALQGSDTKAFSESFDTKNVGSSKTLTPTGTVADGNSGNDYSYTWANVATGSITAQAITVTAGVVTKTYDGTTSAAYAGSVTGTIQGSDTPAFTEYFTSKNVGTGKTLKPTGSVSDGNSGANYTYTFIGAYTGAILIEPITVTATSNTKTYDSTTSAAAVPTVTGGAIQTGDSATWTESYTTAALGTGKTLVPTGSISDGNSGGNYSITWADCYTGVILGGLRIGDFELGMSVFDVGMGG
jgi:hypothetical protein